ncbi:MAG: hypothetical protein N3E41_08420 [Thermofilaceae archaeon]|nr:hypothetical protein [Thermofilaceae archaeon]
MDSNWERIESFGQQLDRYGWREKPFNSFPVAVGTYGLKERVKKRNFQFFPSCCHEFELVEPLPQREAAFNSFPVAVPTSVEPLSPQVFTFNSFPVASN